MSLMPLHLLACRPSAYHLTAVHIPARMGLVCNLPSYLTFSDGLRTFEPVLLNVSDIQALC